MWQRFRSAPAAKFYHQAYAHGLLEHTLTVGQAVSAISASFGGVDRDLAVTGALMHDIGKIEAYSADPTAIDLTDDGKLLGEIPLGYYLVRRKIEQIEGFPWDLARALLHIILSHHGALENGSPVLPATREATVVHAIDNLGGKLGSFDRLQKDLPEGESWSGSIERWVAAPTSRARTAMRCRRQRRTPLPPRRPMHAAAPSRLERQPRASARRRRVARLERADLFAVYVAICIATRPDKQ